MITAATENVYSIDGLSKEETHSKAQEAEAPSLKKERHEAYCS